MVTLLLSGSIAFFFVSKKKLLSTSKSFQEGRSNYWIDFHQISRFLIIVLFIAELLMLGTLFINKNHQANQSTSNFPMTQAVAHQSEPQQMNFSDSKEFTTEEEQNFISLLKFLVYFGN